MSDIKCPRCGEPWDMDELHEMVAEGDYETFSLAYAAFRRYGCVVFNTSHGGNVADPALAELADLLGDDVDGLRGSSRRLPAMTRGAPAHMRGPLHAGW